MFYSYNDNSVDVVTNLTAKFKFDDNILNNSIAYYEYEVSDGETPELIAGKLYGDPEKHWTILMVNNIVNPQNDWLMDTRSLELYIDKKYEENVNVANNETGLDWAKDNTHSYLKVETKTNDTIGKKIVSKIQIDKDTYDNLSTSTDSYTVGSGEKFTVKIEKEQRSYYNYEVEENEKKRSIKILKREVVDVLDAELKRVFSV